MMAMSMSMAVSPIRCPSIMCATASIIVVAVDVTGRPRPPVRLHHSNMELAIGSLLIMFHQVAELRRRLTPPDIYVAPPLLAFSGGDFFQLKELFAAAQPAKDQLKRELDSIITKRLTASN